MGLFSNFSKTKKFGGLKLVPFGLKIFKNSLNYYSYRHTNFPKILPQMARLSITNKCDSRCKTCNLWAYYTKYPEKEKEEITFDEFKKFVDNNHFLEDLTLTGGQVTLRDEIADMWLYLDKKGYRTGGPTNVVDFEKVKSIHNKTLEQLSGKNTHLILISIDGIGEEHDKIRGIKGDFEKSINFLKWAMEKQKEFPFLDISVSHNITPTNYKNFPEFINYMVNLGLDPLQISYRPTVTSDRYYNVNSMETMNSSTKNKEVIGILKKVKKQYKELNNYFMNGTIKYLKNPKKFVVPCYAGYITTFIDPYWNVFACMDSSTLIGNLREADFQLKTLWNSKRAKEVQNNIKNKKCHNCWNPCFAGPSMISNPFKIPGLAFKNLYRIFMK